MVIGARRMFHCEACEALVVDVWRGFDFRLVCVDCIYDEKEEL